MTLGEGDGWMPRARDQRGDVLWLEAEVRRDGRERGAVIEGAGDEKCRLKLLVAKLSLHGETLKGVNRKSGWSLPV
jgi:hypothetical protein